MRPEPPPPTPDINDDLTRRQWLLRLGEVVALAGVSGFVPEAAATLLAQQAATRSQFEMLPPGLYDPSQEHLVHALSSAGKHFAPPPGSETDYVLPNSSPYHAQFFSPGEFRAITRLIEIVLGNVDSHSVAQTAEWLDRWLHASAGVRDAAQHLDPLHRALAVAYYGEDAVRDLETDDPQKVVRYGLAALEELSLEKYAKQFMELPHQQQTELIESSAAAKPGSPLRTLFDLTRRETIRGYYTSAAGLEELDYKGNAFYTECPGCEAKS